MLAYVSVPEMLTALSLITYLAMPTVATSVPPVNFVTTRSPTTRLLTTFGESLQAFAKLVFRTKISVKVSIFSATTTTFIVNNVVTGIATQPLIFSKAIPPHGATQVLLLKTKVQ